MRSLIIRAGSLYVFNVVVLLVIGLLLPTVRVGWHAIWAAVILTAVTMIVKPLLSRIFRGTAEKSASSRTLVGEKVVQYIIIFIIEVIVWILTVLLSDISVRGFFWGYVIPPLILLVAWVIYDQIDDRVQNKAGDLYDAAEAKIDAAEAKISGSKKTTTPPPPTTSTKKATTKKPPTAAAAASEPSAAAAAAAEHTKPEHIKPKPKDDKPKDDGMTPEQRRLLDDLD